MPAVKKQTRTGKTKRVQGVVGGITPVADQPESGIKFLIFGQSGTGKTTLACTFPKPALLIRPEQVEDGSRSVRKVKGLDVTPNLTHCDQLDEIVEYQGNERKYKTLILDGALSYQDLILMQVLGLKEAPAQLSWAVANLGDWGTVSNEFKTHMRNFLRLDALGTHIVTLGGERIIGLKDDDDELGLDLPPSVVIALQPASAGWMHAMMDYNVHTFKRKQVIEKSITIKGKPKTRTVETGRMEYCIHCEHATYATKFRVDKSDNIKKPDIIVDPDYAKLRKLIDGAV